MNREDLPASRVLAALGMAAAGVVAGVLARAVVLGGKVLATGLETLEYMLRAEDEDRPTSPRATVGRLGQERRVRDAEAAPWADGVDALPSEAAFEAPFQPADGLRRPTRTGRSAPRPSSAGVARTARPPRPARRATARSVPPPLRPVRNAPADDLSQPRGAETATSALPAAGAAVGAGEGAAAAGVPASGPTARKTTAGKKATAATKATSTTKAGTAKRATATAGRKTAAIKAATPAAAKAATKQAATKQAATKQAAT
ncbi:MAG: hypothetical protein ACXV1K_10010, partial [Kineosporiaceae bacterium]